MEKRKKKEIVQISNDLNEIRLLGFSATDQNLLMALFMLVQGKSTGALSISYRDLRDICHIDSSMTADDFQNHLDKMSDMLLQCSIRKGDSNSIFKANIFSFFSLSKEKQELKFSVCKDWEYLFNNLQGNFTLFDFMILVKMKSKHSKTLYRMLCQYRGKNGEGWWYVPLEETEGSPGIKALFEIPEYARDKNGNIKKDKDGNPVQYQNKRILDDYIKPAIKEIINEKGFGEIECTAIKAKKHGSPIEGFQFDFKPSKKQKKLSDPLAAWISEVTGLDDESAKIVAKKAKENERDNKFILEAYEIAKCSKPRDLGKLLSSFMDHGFVRSSFDKQGQSEVENRTKKDYNAMVIDELLEEMAEEKECTEPKKPEKLELIEESGIEVEEIPGQLSFFVDGN